MRTAIVVATIEHKDGRVEYPTLRANTTIATLKRRIRKHYLAQGAVHVACGNGIYINSYGAH